VRFAPLQTVIRFGEYCVSFITYARTPNAADIANNGIMFASNDRVGAACKYDYGKCWGFVMAALIMVSTLDVVNSFRRKIVFCYEKMDCS
jgi:hypothetical protein